MTSTEWKIVYIILGMIVAFGAVFFIITAIPASRFDWMFKDDTQQDTPSPAY